MVQTTSPQGSAVHRWAPPNETLVDCQWCPPTPHHGDTHPPEGHQDNAESDESDEESSDIDLDEMRVSSVPGWLHALMRQRRGCAAARIFAVEPVEPASRDKVVVRARAAGYRYCPRATNRVRHRATEGCFLVDRRTWQARYVCFCAEDEDDAGGGTCFDLHQVLYQKHSLEHCIAPQVDVHYTHEPFVQLPANLRASYLSLLNERVQLRADPLRGPQMATPLPRHPPPPANEYNTALLIEALQAAAHATEDFVYSPKTATLILYADKGAGKTEVIARLLRQARACCASPDSHLRVMSIASRRCLADGQAERFGLQNYQTAVLSLDSFASGLVVSPESAHRYVQAGGPLPDVLLLDELELLARHFLSPTLRAHRREFHALLRAWLARVPLVIAADAHLTDVGAWLLEQRRPAAAADTTLLVHAYGYPDTKIEVEVYDYDEDRVRFYAYMLHRARRDGARVAFLSNSVVQLDLVRRLLALDAAAAATTCGLDTEGWDAPPPDDAVLFITADTKSGAREAAFVRDPAAAVRQYRHVLLSTAAGVGVDITVRGADGAPEPYFDAVFAVGTTGSCGAPELLQLLGRVRDPGGNRVFLLVQGEFDDFEKDGMHSAFEKDGMHSAMSPDMYTVDNLRALVLERSATASTSTPLQVAVSDIWARARERVEYDPRTGAQLPLELPQDDRDYVELWARLVAAQYHTRIGARGAVRALLSGRVPPGRMQLSITKTVPALLQPQHEAMLALLGGAKVEREAAELAAFRAAPALTVDARERLLSRRRSSDPRNALTAAEALALERDDMREWWGWEPASGWPASLPDKELLAQRAHDAALRARQETLEWLLSPALADARDAREVRRAELCDLSPHLTYARHRRALLRTLLHRLGLSARSTQLTQLLAPPESVAWQPWREVGSADSRIDFARIDNDDLVRWLTETRRQWEALWLDLQLPRRSELLGYLPNSAQDPVSRERLASMIMDFARALLDALGVGLQKNDDERARYDMRTAQRQVKKRRRRSNHSVMPTPEVLTLNHEICQRALRRMCYHAARTITSTSEYEMYRTAAENLVGPQYLRTMDPPFPTLFHY